MAKKIGAKTILETANAIGFGVENKLADGIVSKSGVLPSLDNLSSSKESTDKCSPNNIEAEIAFIDSEDTPLIEQSTVSTIYLESHEILILCDSALITLGKVNNMNNNHLIFFII